MRQSGLIEAMAGRRVIRIAGPDATHLLGDVLTCTVAEEAGAARWFALLAPQGKILAEGLIGWAEGAYWLDVDESVVANFCKRMRMYRLRAKLEIEDLSETHRVGWSAVAPGSGVVHGDSRAEGLGYRVIAPVAEADDWSAGTEWAEARISAGIATLGPDFSADELFPHDIGMDHLDGVDFKKGCFVGQEVVSRMQHRGTARRRPVIASGVPGDSEAGPALTIAGRGVGTLGQAVAGRAVAIVRIDKIRPDSAVMAGDTAVNLEVPSWARYRFAESDSNVED